MRKIRQRDKYTAGNQDATKESEMLKHMFQYKNQQSLENY